LFPVPSFTSFTLLSEGVSARPTPSRSASTGHAGARLSRQPGWRVNPLIPLLVLLLGSGMTGCDLATSSSDQETYSGHLRIAGASSLATLIEAIANRFETTHPGVEVTVLPQTIDASIAQARQGLADMAAVSRLLTGHETGLQAYPIAVDGIGIIVHHSNPLSGLAYNQIRSVFSGELKQWQHLTGQTGPIHLVYRSGDETAETVFRRHFQLEKGDFAAGERVADDEQLISAVAADPLAMGFVSIARAEVAIDHGEPVKLLPLGGVPASSKTVIQGIYPVSLSLNLVLNHEPKDLEAAFVRFAASQNIHDLLAQQRLVALSSENPSSQ